MKTYKKIDLYFAGDYVYSTNQSKTCKEAVQRCLERLEYNKHYLGLLEHRILKVPSQLKAQYAK